MNVYLDSNIIYSDPFFKQSYSHLTLALARKNIVNIYMSRVVYQEAYNNYRKQIEEMMSEIKKIQSKEKFSTKRPLDEYFEFKQDEISIYLDEFEGFYKELFAQGVITIIEYENDILPELVSRSLHRVQPFTEKKQEFRDAIIWLSYVSHSKKDSTVGSCYLVCNNRNDFGHDNELFEDLQKDSTDFNLVYTLNELISTATEIQKYKKPTDWKKRSKKDQEHIVHNIVLTHCMDDINDSFNTHISYRELYEYLFGINIFSYNGYMDVDVIDITEVGVNEVEALLDNVIIKGHIVGFVSVATYTYGMPGITEESEPDILETNLVQLKISYSLALNNELEYEDFQVEDIQMTHKALDLS